MKRRIDWLAALAGGLLRLPQQIGLKKAMGMILTGRRVSAAEGLALGFVNEVVPADDLMATARRWADEIIAVSPMSIRASKDGGQRSVRRPHESRELAVRCSELSRRSLSVSLSEGRRARSASST